MVRKPRVDENGIKRGAWSQDEDEKLRAYVQRYGHWNWRQLPKFAGLSRCGKSCRLRWLNYLQHNVRRGNYTKEEEDLILKMHQELGNKWSLIAAKLPGRTDNEIKNYWHSRLKKRTTQNSTSCNSMLTEDNIVTDDVSSQETSAFKENQETKSALVNNVSDVCSQQTSEGSSQSAKSSSSELSSDFDYALSNDINLFLKDSITSFESIGTFWTEPFLTEDNIVTDDVSSQETSAFKANQDTKSALENNVYDVLSQQNSEGCSQSAESSSSELSSSFNYALSNDINLFLEDGITSFESIGNFWTEPFLVDGLYHQSNSSSTSMGRGFVSPYDSYYDDSIEFFDQVFIQELEN